MSRASRMSARRWTILITLAAALQFCLALDRRDIVASHEGRVVETASEMIGGGDWLLPHVRGELRLQKPPLPYWTTAAVWRLFGTRQEGLARLMPALFGVLGTLLVMDLARLLLGRRAALIAGLVWISTHFVVDEYRKAMADPYLAFFTLLAAWAWVRSDRIGRLKRVKRQWLASGPLLLLFWIALGFGALSKGPLILLHVLLVVLAYQVAERRLPRWRWSHAVGAGVFLLLAMPWPLYVMAHVPDVAQVWAAESLGEAAGSRHPKPWHHYLVALSLTTLPWTPIAVAGLIWPWSARCSIRQRRMAVFAITWLGLAVAAFSVVSQKKNAYLLPEMPAQTLLISLPLSGWLCRRRSQLQFAGAAGVLAVAVNIAVAWLGAEHANQRSPIAFAHQVNDETHAKPLMACRAVEEQVLFYLDREPQFISDAASLPQGYSGYLLVKGPAAQDPRFAGADVLLVGPERAEEDRHRLLRISCKTGQVDAATN